MTTSHDTTRTRRGRTSHGAAVAALALLAIVAGVPRPGHADTAPAPPPSQCSDFACER